MLFRSRPLIKNVVGVANPFFELLAILTGLSVGWVNYKLEGIGQRYEEKLASVPMKNRQVPPLEVAGSVVRGASIASDAPELQDLFAELLVSASDVRRVKSTHPSFGSLISELEPLDAKILAMFVEIDPRPDLHALEVQRAFELSLSDSTIKESVSNLTRQELVERSPSAIDFDLSRLHFRTYGDPDPQSEIEKLKEQLVEIFSKSIKDPWPLRLTPFGSRFVSVCIPHKGPDPDSRSENGDG